jgi:predicted alpha-1,2-mannosidase
MAAGGHSAAGGRPSPAGSGFATSFETGQPQPTWSSTVETAPDGAAECSGVAQSSTAPAAAGVATTVDSGPPTAYTAKTGVGFTGLKALRYSGYQAAASRASCTDKIYGTSIRVDSRTQLSYEIFPQLMNDNLGAGIPDPSTYVSIDLAFSDGTYLSQRAPVDQNGYQLTAAGQGAAGDLYPNQWNQVVSDIGAVAAGKTISRILIAYDHQGAQGAFQGWIDDLNVTGNPPAHRVSHLADYVSTTRGTQSNGSYSRGSDVPATAMPHGFNFLAPVTDAGSRSWIYNYSTDNNAENLPELQALAISHEPSTWINDREVFQMMPGAGTAGEAPDMTRTGRALAFSHRGEVARPYYYGVTFEGGIKAEMTPTDHAAVMRFTFTGKTSNLVFDNMNDNGSLVLDPSHDAISGYTNSAGVFGAPGSGPMYFYATFSQPVVASGMAATDGCANNTCGGKDVTGYAQFDTAKSKVVTMDIATSFISLDQAKHNLALEIGSHEGFSSVEAKALAAWDKALGVISVKDATYDQSVSLYSDLYRVNLYPDEAYENAGTNARPDYEYASPTAPAAGQNTATHTGLAIKPGYMYVNMGFWDTYRSEWPLDALLYPTLTGHIIQGFLNQYRDGGWLNRWSAPGYVGATPGTTEDVAIADAYLDGVRDFNVPEAYQAIKKDSMVAPTGGAVGRQGLSDSQFIGYSPTDDGTTSADWSLENATSDAGIAALATALARNPGETSARRAGFQADAGFFAAKANNYVNSYNPVVGFFEGRAASGAWEQTAQQYDPRVWGNEFNEGDGWTYSLYVPQDTQGLADLYGGDTGLAKKLDEFFGTHETAQYGGSYGGPNAIHEMVEAATNDQGEWDLSDEPGFGIPYLYDYAGEPYKAQSIVRTALARDFTGSEIGQGYPGDEDNGAMSSWYVFSALGIYPYQVGGTSAGGTAYAIGSPLYREATIHLENGHAINIEARDNSTSNVYVQGLTLDRRPVTTTDVSNAQLSRGADLTFSMGPRPSAWGTRSSAVPGSPTSPHSGMTMLRDVTGPGTGTATGSGGTDVTKLFDNTSATQVTFDSATPAVGYRLPAATRVSYYTLTSGSVPGDPSGWRLQGSNDGSAWTTLDQRSGQAFAGRQETNDYRIAHPGAFSDYRLEVTANSGTSTTTVSEMQLLTGQQLTALPFTEPEQAGATGGITVSPGGTTQVTVGAQNITSTPERITATTAAGTGVTVTRPAAFTAPADGKGTTTMSVTVPKTAGTYPVTVNLTANGAVLPPVTLTYLVITPGDLAPFYDNVGLTDDTNQTAGNIDGDGNSYSAQALAALGITPGSAVSADGVNFAWPDVPAGQKDNIIAQGQTIPLIGQAGATRLGFLGSATYGPSQGTVTVSYTDGSTQQATLAFSDWTLAGGLLSGDSVAAQTAYRNTASGTSQNSATDLFATVIGLESGKTVASVTLPSQANQGQLHIFAITTG